MVEIHDLQAQFLITCVTIGHWDLQKSIAGTAVYIYFVAFVVESN
jgi:hypothetical protein